MRGWIEKTPSANLALVAVVADQIVGDAGLHRFSGRQLHVAGVGLGVHDAWTGKGIGTALLSALVEAADRWLGIWRLELTVYVDNAPAIHLYRRFGFEMEGTHRAFALRDGQYVDAHAMARIIQPAGLAAVERAEER